MSETVRLYPPRSPDTAQFAQFIESYPSTLRLWQIGERNFYQLLAWLDVHPLVIQGAQARRHPLAAALLSRSHHNQLGLCVAWALSFLPGREETASFNEKDGRAAFDLAHEYWRVKNVMAEVRQRVRGFRSRGRRIRISYDGDVRLEAIDRALDLVDDVTRISPDPPPVRNVLRDWLIRGGYRTPWDHVGAFERQAYREYARQLLAKHRFDLRDDVDLGGFTVADARLVLI